MKIYDFESDKYSLFSKTTETMFPGVDKRNIIVYDIDTTSFEAANGCVFMIGVLLVHDGKLLSRHYFSECISDEALIIENFIKICQDSTVLLSYKGDSFDIPYLGKRLYSLGRKDLYDKLQEVRTRSFDLYNEIYPLKNGLNFNSTKLDYLRPKFGHKVSERISGENISKFYVEHIAASKLKSLMDISCRPENAGFIPDYCPKPVEDDLSHITPYSGDRFLKDILIRNRENMEAVLYLLRCSHLFMMRRGNFDVILSNYSLLVERNDFKLNIPLHSYELELKQFYPNYKDYFYFPDEDMAIHKSVAEFASSGSKKKATIRTAYRKLKGCFIKIPKTFAKSENNKASTQYKTCFEAEEYYMPVDELMRLKTEKLKELAYYCTLEYAAEHFPEILI